MAIKLNVDKPGIPVEFGEVSLLFDTSDENVNRLFELKDGNSEELEELEKQREKIKLDKGNITKEQFEEALELTKRTLRVVFDSIFEEGSFDKVYAVYPSVNTIADGFTDIMDELPKEIETHYKRLEKKQANKVAKYRKKK